VAVAVQTELARQGYYDAKVDGIIGEATRRAIREYQKDRGLPVNGQITPALLSSMKIRLTVR
jgi:peptidoglycan hydrolase-like protein with peptidoglycan-binding domain